MTTVYQLPLFASEKRCTICGKVQSLSAFSRDKRSKDGLQCRCRSCCNSKTRDWRSRNPDYGKAYCRAWYQKNKERVRAQEKDAYASNRDGRKDRAKAYNKRYYARTAESQKQKAREWYWQHVDHCREAKRKWRAAHTETHRENVHRYYVARRTQVRNYQRAWARAHPINILWKHRRRRARKAGAEGRHSPHQWAAVRDFYSGRCLRCGSTEDLTTDHVIPLDKGGRDDTSNLQPLCGPCNSFKHTRSFDYRPHTI